MPRVRMLKSVAGVRFSFRGGEEVDLPAEQAKAWVAEGLAEYAAANAKPDTPERGAAPAERRGPGRPRKR